jgi:hypothetical protein
MPKQILELKIQTLNLAEVMKHETAQWKKWARKTVKP